MQTFVPYPDTVMSAQTLDNKRLNKQLLEGRQIYKILAENRRSGGWVNHPAVKMWRNYDTGLYAYLVDIYGECVTRGIKADKNWDVIQSMHDNNWHRGDNAVMPPWWGNERIHASHRHNLYVKDPEYYSSFGNETNRPCCDKCNYFWPTHTEKYQGKFLGYVV